jgi:hypothetical protein
MTLRWALVLTMALMAPVALPAGGAERDRFLLRRRLAGEPLLAHGRRRLQLEPHHQAPILTRIDNCAPLQLLQTWRDRSGQRWLRVRQDGRRGWLAG